MQRYFIEIAYNGSPYHGWQIQQNSLSIQEVLNHALKTILRHSVETTGSGRTDTGVHAKQQFVHLDTHQKITSRTIQSLNSILPHEIAVKAIYSVDSDANARFDAISRTYQYLIHFKKNPFLTHYSYQAIQIPDLNDMSKAIKLLKNYSDFEAFSKTNTQVKTNICKISEATWKETENGIQFEIKADRFLRNMVRAIVGTMLQVGNGTTSLDEFREIIESKNRTSAGFSVPACGLYLTQVLYPNGFLKNKID